jgi:hypothetical protein
VDRSSADTVDGVGDVVTSTVACNTVDGCCDEDVPFRVGDSVVGWETAVLLDGNGLLDVAVGRGVGFSFEVGDTVGAETAVLDDALVGVKVGVVDGLVVVKKGGNNEGDDDEADMEGTGEVVGDSTIFVMDGAGDDAGEVADAPRMAGADDDDAAPMVGLMVANCSGADGANV